MGLAFFITQNYLNEEQKCDLETAFEINFVLDLFEGTIKIRYRFIFYAFLVSSTGRDLQIKERLLAVLSMGTITNCFEKLCKKILKFLKFLIVFETSFLTKSFQPFKSLSQSFYLFLSFFIQLSTLESITILHSI